MASKIKHPEEAICKDFMRLVESYTAAHPELRWLMHIPNGGRRTKAEAGILKAMGVRRGVADYLLPSAQFCVTMAPTSGIGRHYHGLWIEMKAPGGKLTDEQLQFQMDMLNAGYAHAVHSDPLTAMSDVLRYLRGRWD